MGAITLKQLQDAVSQLESAKARKPLSDFEIVCNRDTAKKITAHVFELPADDASLDGMVDRLWDTVTP